LHGGGALKDAKLSRFRFTWLSAAITLVVLTGLLLWCEADEDGLLGLGRFGTLLIGIWTLGLGWAGLQVLYERATRERLVKTARREAIKDVTQRTAEVAAHELAQPLTVVMAYAQWLQRGAATPKEQRYYLEQMVAACHEMSFVLRELHETIRHSRAQAGLTILDEPPPHGENEEAEADEPEVPVSASSLAGAEQVSRPVWGGSPAN
jgi:signal transduction histidine kinase